MTMLYTSIAAGLLACLLRGAGAQTTASASCTDPTFTWASNTHGEDPCAIASQLGGVCIDTTFRITPLPATFQYQGPTLESANQCTCSSVFYSLVSACAACQDRSWLRWTKFSSNCSTVYSTVFPEPLPPATLVPHYAYANVSASDDSFDITAAQADSNGPESSSIPSSTSSPTTISTPTSGSAKKSNSGAIAGGVIGGIVFVALVAGLVIWLLRRRRNNIAPSQAYVRQTQTAPVSFNTTGSYIQPATPKLYDPSDPSTFPSLPPDNSTQQSFLNQSLTGDTGGTHYTTNPSTRYTGAPEV